MDTSHLRFARADPFFYDEPTPVRANGSPLLRADPHLDWWTWRRIEDGDWVHWHPAGAVLPEQGWKIHVSATPSNAREQLTLVSRYCHEQRIAFKHAPSLEDVVGRNGKDAERSASGKFITVYPVDDEQLRAAVLGLDDLVGGLPGPYVLSDLRWKDGPVSVRYGAFARMYTVAPDGRRVLSIRDPEGLLVEDRRSPGFSPPAWVAVPAFLREHAERLADATPPAELRYRPTRALHFSNAGGVYEASDRDGSPVVVKEGRPHAGLTPDGRDAVARLVDEERSLAALAGPGVVRSRGSYELHGHRFLVLDRVDGATLNSAVVARSPLIRSDASPDDHADYRQWALTVASRLEGVIARIHAAGWVHGDLHPGNVIVTEAHDVVLLDFEMARPEDDAPVSIGAPGFVPPDRRAALAADRYALACIKLFLFLPLTPLLVLDPAKADDLLREAGRSFALDDAWLCSVRDDLGLEAPGRGRPRSALARAADDAVSDWNTGDEDGILRLQVMIGRSLTSSADFSRADRAWPGDPRQFAENGFGIAHGAAGVVHALDSCSLDVDPQAVEWLDQATHGQDAALGLYDGLAGVAWLSRRAGRHGHAERLLRRVLDADPTRLGSDLYGGLPGIGLVLLSEADEAPASVGRAADLARILAERHADRRMPDPDDPAPSLATDAGGLMWGATGTALLALRLFETTGDREHLRLAEATLDYDLRHCTTADDGSLQLNEGWRLMPYLASGSAGVGLVAAQLLWHTNAPERYLGALTGIRAAASAPFTIEPGLFSGRAGLIHFLVSLSRAGLATTESDDALAAHVDALRLHAVRHRTGIGFPGRGLLRLSCDLATGSAGVLLALQAYGMHAFDDHRPGWDDLLPLLTNGVSDTSRSCG